MVIAIYGGSSTRRIWAISTPRRRRGYASADTSSCSQPPSRPTRPWPWPVGAGRALYMTDWPLRRCLGRRSPLRDRPGNTPSYTAHTAPASGRNTRRQALSLIRTDMLLMFEQWYAFEKLLSLAELACFRAEGS
jgi:hypothetical protein